MASDAALAPVLQGDLVEGVRASYDASLGQPARQVERSYVLGGQHIAFRSADAELLRRLTRAFAHLRVDGPASEPRLVVHLWESSWDVPPPPLPELTGEEPPGAFLYARDGAVRFGYQVGVADEELADGRAEVPSPSLTVLDDVAGEAWFWVADARRLPYWETAAPVRFLLDWWLRDRGVHQVHGGAVGRPDGGALLVGKGGSGKSTSALSSLQSDLFYAADDYVGVSIDPQPHVHSLYGSGKVMPDHLRRLPFLAPALDNGDHLEAEKAVVFVHEHWPLRMSSGFPLRAVLVPRVRATEAGSHVREISRVEALRALAPSTVFQMHTRGGDSLARMTRLVERVPCFALELGYDIAGIPVAIAGLLDRLGPRQ